MKVKMKLKTVCFLNKIYHNFLEFLYICNIPLSMSWTIGASYDLPKVPLNAPRIKGSANKRRRNWFSEYGRFDFNPMKRSIKHKSTRWPPFLKFQISELFQTNNFIIGIDCLDASRFDVVNYRILNITWNQKKSLNKSTRRGNFSFLMSRHDWGPARMADCKLHRANKQWSGIV